MRNLKEVKKYTLNRLPKIPNLDVFVTEFTNSSLKTAVNLEIHINNQKMFSSTAMDIDDAIIDIYQKMYNNLYYRLENIKQQKALNKTHTS